MGFHPVTGWFGINNVIGRVGFNFPLVFLVGCGMDIKVIRFGYGWEWIGFFAISRPMSEEKLDHCIPQTKYTLKKWTYNTPPHLG
jgi:hypothetical protein